MSARRAQVLIAAEALPTRTGLRLALERDADCVEAGDGPSAVATARASQPDVCVIDLEAQRQRLRTVNELQARVPEAAIIVLTDRLDEDEFMAVVRAGASGYLPQNVDPSRLPAVVQSVMRGETAFPRRFVRRLIDELRGRGDRYSLSVEGRSVTLTAREWEVVELFRLGYTTREIAERLGISQITARRHLGAIEGKVGARTRADLLDILVPERRSGV
ncbi:MAG TPA: response regulator transcription factor [Gaiellaceae bacterium]